MRWTTAILLGLITLSFELVGGSSFLLVGKPIGMLPAALPRSVRWEQVWVGRRVVRICEQGRCRVEYRDQYQWREIP